MKLDYYDLHAGTTSGFWIRFVLVTLASWRISHLLVVEDGPWEVFARLRRRLGASAMGRLMDCFGCVSVWVTAPFSLFLSRTVPDVFFCWFALSGAAFLLERMSPEPLVIQPDYETTKGENLHVLR